jgi:beta-galactosidase
MFVVRVLILFHFLALVGAGVQLAGEWRFEMDRNDEGVEGRWFERELVNRIKLPGVLQAQGYGDEISVDTPWVVGLGGEWWKLQPQELRDAFSQPGRVEVPFLAQPPRHYLGAAWYQRDVEVPAEWKDRRVVLSLERPRWESTVWIGDREIGSARSLVAPHEFDLGVLDPGKHSLTIRLDNRMIVRDPKGNVGHMPDAHAVSDALGSTWNGIAGKIELRSTPQVWLSDVQAFPNVAAKSVKLRVSIGNITGGSGSGTIEAGGVKREVEWVAGGGEAEIDITLGDDAKTWDEFSPNLQHLDVKLDSAAGGHMRKVAFGLREISWRGLDPLINGRIVNFRTTNFGLDFPLTGYPATDVDSWRKIIRRCQEFGLNGIRFHSCCPPEAAFVAADELGFYLQPECGLWAPFYPDGVYTKYLEEETELLLKAYGNHPSFVLFAPSNEPAGRYTEVTPQWAKRWYERDPRRLYSAGTGWNRAEQVTGGAQFASLVRFGSGELRNVTGWFGNDFREALEGVEIPVLAHEIGQWCAYPEFDVIDKFTGYLRPSNYRIFRHIAERNGVADLNERFAMASGKFQLACYKEELEANLRTPGLAGHQMLDIRDYLGQGTALIGVLDAFWDPKSYVKADEFRRFHSKTVPLARLQQRTFTSGETLESEVGIYHFGAHPLSGAKPYWKIMAAGGAVLRKGSWEARDIPIGKDIALGHVRVALDSLPAPAAYKLVVGLEGVAVENDWNFWLYPDKTEPATPEGLLMTSDWKSAAQSLREGRTVLFTPDKDDIDPAKSPPMKKVPVFWNIQMTVRPPRNPVPRFDAMLGLLCEADHPALSGFPTESFCDWQWTSIIDGVRSVNLTSAPHDLRPIVYSIDDWNRNWRLGVIFECRVGHGRLLVSAIPLDKDDPVTRAAPRFVGELCQCRSRSSLGEPHPGAGGCLVETGAERRRWARQAPFDPDLDDGTGPASAR